MCTVPKNITTKPEEVLHQNGRKFTKFTQHHVNEGGGDGSDVDEARYNLATRVMSNGVELIVADGKSTLPGEPNFFRILTNSKNYNRPLTLAPSTLNNVMMLMTLGGKNPKIDNIPENAILNRFVTKTCLTTYTYLTTYEMNGSTMIESREKVISNIATEERNTHNLTPLIASDMTFFKTPNLRVGEFSTTYTYYNTIMDDDVPIVATSKHVVVNTITAADDYLKMIQPTLSASPVYETNTYYSTVEFSKTINDDEITKVINTRDVITQVIVTESLPHGRMPMSMSHDLIESHDSAELSPSAEDYDDETENHKYIKKTSAIDTNPTRIVDKPSAALPLQFYATKTYLTTFTYFTTLLQNGAGSGGEISSTVVDSHTRIIENVVTESIPSSLVPNEILDRISKTIIDDAKTDLKTRIKLKNGHKMEITAANILKPVDYATTSTAEISSIETNDLEVAANDLSPAVLSSDDDENENSVGDIGNASSEENVVVPIQPQQDPIRISPKPKPASSGSLKIPSLLNRINIPSFSALGPVINAMAGILTSNFGTQTAAKVQPVLAQAQPLRTRPEYEPLPQPLPLISQDNQDAILSQTESKNKVPLYIPIREPNSPSHHASMMGSGIAISPGDVITANSDVIVGRPAVIGPKLPANINKPQEIAGMEAPPPFVPLKTPQRPSSFVKDIKSNGNINQVTIKKGDDYFGPPPPPKDHHVSVQNKPIPLSNFPRQPMPHHLQKIQPMIPPMLRPHSGEERPGNILVSKPTPTQESQVNNHYIKINHQQPSQQHKHKPQLLPMRNQPVRQNHHFNHHKRPIPVIEAAHNPAPQNIIEIQKIPEVYSTDLPIITVNNHYPSSTAAHDIVAHELPEILDKPTNGQPLLVDIQPSQVANVVIPHNSNSVLIFGGVHEAHKAGHYYNDPPPHANAEVGIKSVNLFADVASISGNIVNQPQQHQTVSPVHYDVIDNIIVASDSMAASPSNVNLLVSPLASPTARPNDYIHNSVHFSPSNVITFNPSSSIAVAPFVPNKQQIINQQREQQIAIEQQLKQKHLENQMRMEMEDQKRQEYLHRQKFIEQQKRKEYEGQQRLKFEQQRKQEYERQKAMEQQKRQHEIENQKRLEQQQKAEYEMQLRQQFEQQKKQQEIKNRIKNQIVLPHRPPVRPEIPIQNIQKNQPIQLQNSQHIQLPNSQHIQLQNSNPIQHQNNQQNNNPIQLQNSQHIQLQNSQTIQHQNNQPIQLQNSQNTHKENSGFIVLTSNYNSGSNSQNSFLSLPPYKPQGTVEAVPISVENNASENDGHEVQESINRPKLPSGENHNEFEDDSIKDIEEYDNFVYHKITAASSSTTETTTTRRTTQTSPITTRRSSTVPISTERVNVQTTQRHGPIYMPKPYPNHQFEDLPILVNDLQHRNPPTSRPTNFQRIPTVMPLYKTGNTISQSMKPPAAPKISRRPTHPFNIHKTTFKISMPIDPMPDDVSVINNLQTEVPFNPIYTQTENSVTTEKHLEVAPETTTNVQYVMFSRGTDVVTTTDGSKLEKTTSESDLNIGEVETVKVHNYTEENSEVFDSKESINVHNHGFVSSQNVVGNKIKHEKDDFDLMPPSNKNNKPYQTIIRAPDLTTYKSTNVKLEVTSSELETMKPPAPLIPRTKSSTKSPTFEEIVNMKPPPVRGDEKTVEVPRVKPPYSNVQRPTISLSRFTPSTQNPLITTTNRSKTLISTYRPPLRVKYTSMKPIELEVVDDKPDYKEKEKEVISSKQSTSITSTPTLSTSKIAQMTINTAPTISSVTHVSSSVRKEVNIPRFSTINYSKRLPIVHNTTILTEQIITSTKWIQFTNTKTITLSKTKTETIHHNRGIPVVSTSIHTVYETITETETLLKPTIITSIHPTKTIIRETIIPTYPSTTEQIIEGFVSSEDLDEFIINDYDSRNGSIVHVNSKEIQNGKKRPVVDNESIFVVVNDKNNQHKINIDPSIIKHTTLYNHSSFINDIEDVSRDEEDTNDGAGHILLGGILIASPPQLNKSQQGAAVSGICFPECNKVNNEYCHRTDGIMRCTCRPGFARMFPDRPCKPIYTYIMKIGLNRIGRDRLDFDPSLLNKTTTNYTKLQETTYNGVDRMLMQSDLRDIYHSIEVIGFNKTKENGVTGKLFIQLSENTNEKKLRETVKKYLRMSNYNLGGTELYANPLVTDLETYDFDECSAADDKSHDCSEFSHCFNLLGTYTCSCMEGFADESENPIYPGRLCVRELVGCERCHYHGTCLTQQNEQIVCECFQWYAGQQCQVNLKLLLFGLVIAGLTLFTLLMICIIITCVKKKKITQNSIGPAMNVIQRRISSAAHHSVGSNADRKAMIQDTSSEASEDHEPAPYFRKKSNDESSRKVSVEAVAPKKKKSVVHNPLGSFSKATTVDQRDRSLTVMIPRAKYHPAITKSGNLVDVEGYKSKSSSSASVNQNQSKLLNYLESSPSSAKAKSNVPCKKSSSYQPQNPGSLVSAGFKVSAAGGSNSPLNTSGISTNDSNSNNRISKTTSHHNVNEIGSKYYAIHKISTVSEQPIMSSSRIEEKSQLSVVRKSYSHGNLMENMDDWLDNGNNTEAMSEARSYDETTIQAPTKAIRNLYYKQLSHTDGNNTEDMNTMAERDMASTVLLPHTHLYKPTMDRGSDISGFDSL